MHAEIIYIKLVILGLNSGFKACVLFSLTVVGLTFIMKATRVSIIETSSVVTIKCGHRHCHSNLKAFPLTQILCLYLFPFSQTLKELLAGLSKHDNVCERTQQLLPTLSLL